ncbi:hypothetical protein N644_3075 [Lactiplantibacillus paraplantarum]|nr:hypothetical protein N644_3075 [Lactiplantibacillus paraplantarum]KRL49844.1 hypothetical protein FD48_GL003094 [Lactiplantibacillus paraplantarum DSM 10667]
MLPTLGLLKKFRLNHFDLGGTFLVLHRVSCQPVTANEQLDAGAVRLIASH